MSYNRHIRPVIATLLLAASATAATPRVELSAGDGGVRIDVSDDAPGAIELVGDELVPVRWQRGGRSRATLPLIATPGAADTIEASVIGERQSIAPTARVRIDADRYATPWPTERGRWPMVAATAALALLLAARVPRRPALAVAIAAAAITVGLLIFAARRSDFERREQGDVTWLRARRATVARLPIAPGDAPIVESRSHLRSLSPRVEVDAEGRATLELTMSRGARVAIERRSR